MFPNCAGGSNPPNEQKSPVIVRFTKAYENFQPGEEHEILSQDPVEEVVLLGEARVKVPYHVLERTDGEPFDTLDDLLGVARAQLALRTT